MIALIPNRDGHIISEEVIKGIQRQTIPIDIMVVSRPQEDFVYGNEVRKGWKSIEICRNILREEALKRKDEFFLLINNDVVMLNDDDVMCMLDFLKKDTNCEYGAVAIDTINIDQKYLEDVSKDHVCIALMLIRRFVLENIKFKSTNGMCDCLNLMLDMKRLDKYNKCKYILNRKAKECSH